MSQILNIDLREINSSNFEEIAFASFKFQYKNNEIYRQYCQLIKVSDPAVLNDIPFLPIEFFKTKKIVSSDIKESHIFKSSATGNMGQSSHYVLNSNIYLQSFRLGFQQFFGNIHDYTLLCLLPSYLEQENSSLVYMLNQLVKDSNNTNSGFYLKNHSELFNILQQQKKSGGKTILFGATFGLLDFAEKFAIHFPNLKIVETGGMKGRRKEQTKDEIHKKLSAAFGVNFVYSEYGMTELFSQAYSSTSHVFTCPAWMKVVGKEITDPLSATHYGKNSRLCFIDLANIYTCSFIATSDIGKIYSPSTFQVSGRLDESDIRGCNLLVL